MKERMTESEHINEIVHRSFFRMVFDVLCIIMYCIGVLSIYQSLMLIDP